MSIGTDFATLLDGPAAAVLTTYRRDGTAVASPVWFRRAGEFLEVVIAEDDPKLRHLMARSDCSLLVLEAVPPFRGVRIEARATIHPDHVIDTRRAIARRYLGRELGDRFTASRGPGVIVQVPLVAARTWDLSAILPH